jgi:hypothetical protein
MDKTLKFWTDVEANDVEIAGKPNADKSEKTLAILQVFHKCGLAMRRLDDHRRVVWKATPKLIEHLRDEECQAQDDLDSTPID